MLSFLCLMNPKGNPEKKFTNFCAMQNVCCIFCSLNFFTDKISDCRLVESRCQQEIAVLFLLSVFPILQKFLKWKAIILQDQILQET